MAHDEMTLMKQPKHGRSKIETHEQSEIRMLTRKVYELTVENGTLKQKIAKLKATR
jgi:hypothetical protein